MAQQACKRFWEGTVGIAIRPQQRRGGGYFWTFAFVRAFKRNRDSQWEYAQHYGQQHAKAVGLVMTKAFQFMEQTDPAEFLATSMAAITETTVANPDEATDVCLETASFRSSTRAAA